MAANDGVMPQTVEALNHAKAAGVPIVVAVNKIDLPDANVERVKQQLSELGLTPEEWGGQTQFIAVSALKRLGLDELLEAILLLADVLELKANPKPMGRGVVVEARLDQGRGAVATVLVQKATLEVGDPFVAGGVYGRVRAMFDDAGREVKTAGPATPVEVLGFSGVPESGDRFIAVPSEKEARDFAVRLGHLQRERALRPTAHVSLESLSAQISAGQTKELNVIIKGDVQGSVEALKESLGKLSTEKVKVVVRHSGVGAVNVSDVYLADTTDSLIIGFSVRVNPDAQSLAHSLGVNIRIYEIIFNALEDVRGAMSGLLEKRVQENILGHCEVREVFRVQKSGSIAGCYVTDGKLVRNARIRVKRDDQVKFEGALTTLRRFKDDAREVASGFECGVGLGALVPFEPGDVIECYELLEVAQTL
ncbi:translation initiation factor IF-2 [bacterium]|nr:translation initiation factor IF-2 [bacterium]